VEVLAEAAATPTRRGAVLHVLESTVIGWIKQIKVLISAAAVRIFICLPSPFNITKAF